MDNIIYCLYIYAKCYCQYSEWWTFLFYIRLHNKLSPFPSTANLQTKMVLLHKKCLCRSVQQRPEITTAQQMLLQTAFAFSVLSWSDFGLLVLQCSFCPCQPDVLRLIQSPHFMSPVRPSQSAHLHLIPPSVSPHTVYTALLPLSFFMLSSSVVECKRL